MNTSYVMSTSWRGPTLSDLDKNAILSPKMAGDFAGLSSEPG
jgi:hypothetical protein